MEVFLIRHGTRNFTLGDVPLNEEGQEEAIELSNDEKLQHLNTLLSSPKKRAQMTLEPLAEKLGTKIKIFPELDQMERNENELQFKSRVGRFLNRVEQQEWPSPLIVCSHSDWLATAMQIIPSNQTDLKYQMFHCCEYLHFQVDDGLWIVRD